MNQPTSGDQQIDLPNRRSFLKTTSAIAAASALAGVNIPHVFAAEDNTIRLALIGCGGRGGGAAANAMSTPHGPVKLVAMADVFEDKIRERHDGLYGQAQYKPMMEVPEDRRFVGFNGYQEAMDCLRPGDVAILTTPPAFRAVHFKYAIDKGLNVFMEKPVTTDGPMTRQMYKLADESLDKNLKVGVGLMCRHCDARRELFDRIQMGQIGDIVAMRAYRVHGPVAECFVPKNPGKLSENLYQVKNFHAFLWASGGLYSDFYIHNIDECCWMKDMWPVKAEALGGRHYRGDNVDQNFDTYDVEYTFPDGAKMFFMGRCIDGCQNQFATFAHGTKGSAQVSNGGHAPSKARIYRTQDMTQKPIWAYPSPEANPYQLEWDHLMYAIRKDKPFNEVKRGAEVSLITSMGRMAAHTGQPITRQQMWDCDHEFAPTVGSLTADGPAPVMPDKDGKYPIPQPGVKKDREY